MAALQAKKFNFTFVSATELRKAVSTEATQPQLPRGKSFKGKLIQAAGQGGEPSGVAPSKVAEPSSQVKSFQAFTSKETKAYFHKWIETGKTMQMPYSL